MSIRLSRWSVCCAVLLLLPLLFLFRSFQAAPLPQPKPYLGALPPAMPPPEMAIFHLPTGSTHRSAAFGYRGGSFLDKRDFAMTAVLVKHPKGDLLIDTGFGRDIDAQFAKMPFLFRLGTQYEKRIPAIEQLAKSGYDIKNLRSILLTHAHWDHVSGISDFPGIPVLVTKDERQFIENGGSWTAVVRSLSRVKYEAYDFEEKSYLGFPQSRDVYGDGSIVIVSAPGHTPGSVIVFLILPHGERYALVGDLVWQQEGVTEREEKPWPLRFFADSKPDQVRENILRMSAIALRFPEMIVVPAHDSLSFVSMPQL